MEKCDRDRIKKLCEPKATKHAYGLRGKEEEDRENVYVALGNSIELPVRMREKNFEKIKKGKEDFR